jgi:hypothetical protein
MEMAYLLLVMIKQLANIAMRRITSLSWIVLVMVFTAPVLARTWTDSSGTHRIDGEFVNLTDGKVKIRGEDGKEVHVPLDKLSDQDQKYVQNAMSDRKRSHFIEAEGSGNSSDEALKDAFREAVRRAVGAYVDEETRVENDEVIKDQVLTHSKGFIDSYEKLSEKSEDGVTHVTIRAVVKPDAVVSCLRKANVAMSDLPGEQFWAKVVSQRHGEKDAESLLRKALEGFPENCLKAEPVGEPRQDHNETVTRLGITVRIAVDPPAYQAFSRELHRVLDQISKRKPEQETETTFIRRYPPSELPVLQLTPTEKFIHALLGVDHSPALSGGTVKKPRVSTVTPNRRSSPAKRTSEKYSFDADVGEDIVVALNVRASNSGAQLKWKRYLLDKSLRPLLTEVAARKLSCRIMLVDSAGSEVAAQTIPSGAKKLRDIENFAVTLSHGYSHHEATPGRGGAIGPTRELNVVLVSQVFFSPKDTPEELPQLRYDRVFDLSDAELRSVKQTLCKLSRLDAGDTTTRHNRKNIRSK